MIRYRSFNVITLLKLQIIFYNSYLTHIYTHFEDFSLPLICAWQDRYFKDFATRFFAALLQEYDFFCQSNNLRGLVK